MFRSSSSYSTSPSSPPRSYASTPDLEMPGRASTRTSTSLWSDDPTEVPPSQTQTHGKSVYGNFDNEDGLAGTIGGAGTVKEGRLIDYDPPSDHDEDHADVEQIAPGDKLRELLRMMQQEVEVTKSAYVQSEPQSQAKSQPTSTSTSNRRDWRRGRFQAEFVSEIDDVDGEKQTQERDLGPGPSYPTTSRDSSPERRYSEGQDEEEQSPPTPPPRIGNPYSARRVERRGSPSLTHSGRLTSRAAVLLNSTSRSPPPEPEVEPEVNRSPPTRLEAFLASSPPIPPSAAEASTSRSINAWTRSLSRSDSFSSSTSSRKGKGRAPILADERSSSFTRRKRNRQSPVQTPSSPEATPHSRRLPPTTPRRISVDLAPDDLASFARNVEGLEVRAEMELDLDEGLSGLGWDDPSESVVDASHEVYHGTRDLRRSVSASLSPEAQEEDRRERSHTAQLRGDSRSPSPSPLPSSPSSPPPRPKSREASLRTSHSSLRNSQTNRPFPASSQSASADRSLSPPLPALPEPEFFNLSNTSENEADTHSSRRAALFRSTSRSTSEGPSAPAFVSAYSSRYSARSSLGNRTDDQAQLQNETASASFRTDLGSKSRIARTSFEVAKEASHAQGQSQDVDRDVVESPILKDRMLPRRSLEARVSPLRSALLDDAREGAERPSRLSKDSPEHSSPSVHTRVGVPRRSPSAQDQAFSSNGVITPQSPIRVGMAFTSPSPALASAPAPTSAPSRVVSTPVRANLTLAPTPKPPGAWQSTPKGKVRFTPSPLGKASPIRGDLSHSTSISQVHSHADSVSIHRLRLSPRRTEKEKGKAEFRDQKSGKTGADDVAADVGETSFIGRLKESLSGSLSRTRDRIPIPRPSTTFSQASTTLQSAQEASSATASQLQMTQKEWLEALSSLNTAILSGSKHGAGGVGADFTANAAVAGEVGLALGLAQAAKRGWKWSTWLWWILIEVVVLWSVFRVTLDYATSISHLTSIDPFHPLSLPFRQPSIEIRPLLSSGAGPPSAASGHSSGWFLTWGKGPFGPSSPIALDIPIPSALQNLVGANHGSANFFDLVQGWELWRRLVDSSVGTAALGVGADAGAGAGTGRMLGGVPS